MPYFPGLMPVPGIMLAAGRSSRNPDGVDCQWMTGNHHRPQYLLLRILG